jgi:hypothetical protein
LGPGFTYNLDWVTDSGSCPAGVCWNAPNPLGYASQLACNNGRFCDADGTKATDAECATAGYCSGDRTIRTQAQCTTATYCDGPEGGDTRREMLPNECARCGGTMKSRYTWVAGTRTQGFWQDITWRLTGAIPRYAWGTFLDINKFQGFIMRVVVNLLADIFKSVVSCVQYPIMRAIQEVANACTADGKIAHPNTPIGFLFPIARAKFFRGIRKLARLAPGATLSCAEDGVAGNDAVEVSVSGAVDANDSPAPGGGAARRLLGAANVYDAATSSSLVGETVGNGLNIDTTGTTFNLCLDVDQAKVSASTFYNPTLAKADATTGKISATTAKVSDQGTKYCADVTGAGSYYPAKIGFKPAAAGAGALIVGSLIALLPFVALFF